MRSNIKNSKTFLLLSGVLLFTAWTTSLANDELLQKAWKEYWLQNFSGAERLFTQVIGSNQSTKDQQIEAKLGKAMIVAYKMPGRDPKKAVPMYREILSEISKNNHLVPQLLILIGRAFAAEKNTKDSAMVYFENVLKQYPETNFAREAVLEIALLRISNYKLEEIPDIIKFIESDLEKYPSHPYAGIMHGTCGTLALNILKDYSLAQKHLIAWYQAGISNLTNKPTVLFQIAQISEKKLNDPLTAIKYYQLLVDNHPTDMRNYYSRCRIEELKSKTTTTKTKTRGKS